MILSYQVIFRHRQKWRRISFDRVRVGVSRSPSLVKYIADTSFSASLSLFFVIFMEMNNENSSHTSTDTNGSGLQKKHTAHFTAMVSVWTRKGLLAAFVSRSKKSTPSVQMWTVGSASMGGVCADKTESSSHYWENTTHAYISYLHTPCG